MGVPIAALGALAAAAGTGAQVQASRQTSRAQNAAVQAELDRQRSYREQGNRQFQASLAKSTEPVAQTQVDEGAAARQAIMDRTSQVPLTASQGAPIQAQGVDVVTPSLQRSGAARAALQGYSEWDLQQWIKNLRAQENLRILQQFAHGSASVLPYELQDAAHSQDALFNTGKMLQALGGVAGAAGAGGFGAMDAPGLTDVPLESQIATGNSKVGQQPRPMKIGYGYQ